MSDFSTRNQYFDALFATDGLLWMGQNTNHIPAHPAVTKAMADSIARAEFNAYAPPLGFEALRKAIVADLGVPGVEAVVTDGGVTALATICRARCRPGTALVTTDPTWKWPCLFARQQGADVIEIPIYDPATDYKLTPDALDKAVDERTAIIYIVDPNNPLGICYSKAEIEAFSEIARRNDALLVHDCTYRDFATGHYPALNASTDNTIVTMSFSKWLGLAGLRIGTLVAKEELAAEMASWSTGVLGSSVIAQRAAIAGLKVKDEWMKEVRRINAVNQRKIKDTVETLGFSVAVYPSNGNFLVIETVAVNIRPEALVAAAKEEGIMIRQGTYHTERFGDRFIKISTSVPTEWADILCDKLPALVERARTLNDVEAQF
ncbi:MAG: pyridoxal phosphate-dependent aminotransferase [Alphaproteobacteria bacterium]|nr:pyridoxal phosphate-dependent aminotransferase [Alphaproteobacteria bacterium]MBU0803909.1 pyridoxal phosphate-dependent aminotransferase [Alphaproteobacteria bacterium]MBU0872794.1 pyridoxal phosphate-dependent aminotransferase [Alphaproteobacteria bacterium]MBU1402836.1 pyridoxal phosphate-dependent aminotransferase [Alphaproteobacteria bacterium]MBU1593478.1 pyridoxal phosphate-dependent aminotransferase [Alphaproteobacteria bacterium]